MNGKVKVVCGAKKFAGFEYQLKSNASLFRKTFPPVCKAAHLPMEFASTPPQWCAGMATHIRCPILRDPPQTTVPQSIYLITVTHECGDSKTTRPCHSPGRVRHQIKSSFLKFLATVEPKNVYAASAAGQ